MVNLLIYLIINVIGMVIDFILQVKPLKLYDRKWIYKHGETHDMNLNALKNILKVRDLPSQR